MSLGLFVVFGVLFAPLYLTVIAWLVGEPRDSGMAGTGVGYVVGILAVMVLSLFLFAITEVLLPP